GRLGTACCPAAHVIYLLKHLIWGQSQRNELNITLCCFFFQEGEQFVKKIGGIFAFKVKDGPGGKEATWVVDVKNGKGSVLPNSDKKADCTITMADSDLLALMTGKMNPQTVRMMVLISLY
uniref:SCP2 domain-containing protein n=1 Tax=Capra hircus TaxID=9925 RepID=A0A8C2NLX4_CAPHI